jgi:hypothetical protein
MYTNCVSCTLAKQCGICLTWRVDADGVLEAGADDDLRHEDGHEDEQKLEGSKTVLIMKTLYAAAFCIGI